MTRDPISLNADCLPEQVLAIVNEHPHHLYPVIEKGRLVGVITRESIAGGQGDLRLVDIASSNYHSISKDSSAADAFELMTSKKISTLVVTDSEGGSKLTGIITRIDVFNSMEHLDERHHAY